MPFAHDLLALLLADDPHVGGQKTTVVARDVPEQEHLAEQGYLLLLVHLVRVAEAGLQRLDGILVQEPQVAVVGRRVLEVVPEGLVGVPQQLLAEALLRLQDPLLAGVRPADQHLPAQHHPEAQSGLRPVAADDLRLGGELPDREGLGEALWVDRAREGKPPLRHKGPHQRADHVAVHHVVKILAHDLLQRPAPNHHHREVRLGNDRGTAGVAEQQGPLAEQAALPQRDHALAVYQHVDAAGLHDEHAVPVLAPLPRDHGAGGEQLNDQRPAQSLLFVLVDVVKQPDMVQEV
mmetsp:Transcript_122116/g.331595  ORF Transcript_122116/g.331595 Transcript_122116/m.331595 type:complete len:292 (+) Transcript_122116:1389-2264(+)